MVLDIDLNDGELKNIKPKATPSIKPPVKIKVKKKRPVVKGILITLLILIVGAIGFASWKGITISNAVGFKLNPVEFLQEKKPELKKDAEGKHTNVLIVGVDSRNGSDISNTDVIIVASYNYETKNVTMISIPRDFFVEIGSGTKWFNKINSVYVNAEGKAKGTGFEALQKSVAEVTGLETQYYALVDFKAFVEIIDKVGGVNINVENSFTDNRYPEGLRVKTVKFTAGPQTMDGETALIYSRSRYSQNLIENGDYARAKRQQKVVSALADKISEDETFKDPQKVMGVISSLVNNIKISEFTITDIRAGINLLEEFTEQNGKSYSFVLDPTSGGGTLIQGRGEYNGVENSHSLPVEGYGKYDNILKYINSIDKNPKLFSEKAPIYVHDIGLGYAETTKKVKEMREANPYTQIIQSTTLFKDKEGDYVYSNVETFPETINVFSKYLKTSNKTKPEFITSTTNKEGVIILLGKPTQLSNEN